VYWSNRHGTVKVTSPEPLFAASRVKRIAISIFREGSREGLGVVPELLSILSLTGAAYHSILARKVH